MSYPNSVDESVRTESEPSRPRVDSDRSGAAHKAERARQRNGHPDHTNSGGFCSCCGMVYPCRAARCNNP
jgi:hypothetical protein